MAPPLAEIGPASRFFLSQRLRLHYVDWGSPEAPLLLLVHGGRDHARSWDWVAHRLRERYHVVAPDLRGHGDSAWALGSSYALSDFAFDLAQLVDAVAGPEQPVTIVGHSLGGAISLQYSGAFPERVQRLVAIEGLGPPPQVMEQIRNTPGWQRLRNWMDSLQSLASRQTKRYASIEDAAKRMQEENGFLSAEQAHHLTVHGVNRNEDGSFSWKFDNYTRAFSPTRFTESEIQELRARITCPVLLVRGTESWAQDPSLDGRTEPFQNARVANIEGAGHWVHHDRLDAFLDVVTAFLAEDGETTE